MPAPGPACFPLRVITAAGGAIMKLRDSKPPHSRAVRSASRRARARRRARVPYRTRNPQKHVANGMSAPEARTRALARFGSVACRRGVPRRARHDVHRRPACATSATPSARSAARPSRPLTIVATVALGLGLVAVVFTFLNASFPCRCGAQPRRAVRGGAPADAGGEPVPFTRPEYERCAARPASSPMRSRCWPTSTAASTAA